MTMQQRKKPMTLRISPQTTHSIDAKTTQRIIQLPKYVCGTTPVGFFAGKKVNVFCPAMTAQIFDSDYDGLEMERQEENHYLTGRRGSSDTLDAGRTAAGEAG